MQLPKIFSIIVTPVLAAILLTLSSCDKDENPPPSTDNTIAGIVILNNDFGLFEQAVMKAELAGTLLSPGPFTVFAPDDAAFAASDINSAAINGLSQSEAASIILYHTLATEVRAADIPAGPNAIVTTASGDSVYVTKNASGVYINGIKVTQTDIDADNGVIHKIGRVLMPPGTKTIVDVAVAGGLDSLVKAIVRATNAPGGDPTLAEMTGTATITVFAPTNQAFTDLLSALSLTDIDDIPVATLSDMLRYHMVDGRTFSSDFANGPLSMLAGGNTMIDLTNGTGGGPTITGTGASSNIIATNIVGRNGVVHLIDRVLLP